MTARDRRTIRQLTAEIANLRAAVTGAQFNSLYRQQVGYQQPWQQPQVGSNNMQNPYLGNYAGLQP